jgi:DNA-binding NtrC family response regulator
MKPIIILDDDDSIRITLDAFLVEEGYTVVSFSRAIAALDYLSEQTTPHVVIVDYLMPEMRGDEFLQRAQRELPPHLTHRYIVYAARPLHMLPPQLKKTLTTYNVPFIRKPFGLDDILAIINTAMDA